MVQFAIRTMHKDLDALLSSERGREEVAAKPLVVSPEIPFAPPKPVIPAPAVVGKEETKVTKKTVASTLLSEGLVLFKDKSYLAALEKLEQAGIAPASWWTKFKIRRAVKRCQAEITKQEKGRQEEQRRAELKLKAEIDERLKREQEAKVALTRGAPAPVLPAISMPAVSPIPVKPVEPIRPPAVGSQVAAPPKETEELARYKSQLELETRARQVAEARVASKEKTAQQCQLELEKEFEARRRAEGLASARGQELARLRENVAKLQSQMTPMADEEVKKIIAQEKGKCENQIRQLEDSKRQAEEQLRLQNDKVLKLQEEIKKCQAEGGGVIEVSAVKPAITSAPEVGVVKELSVGERPIVAKPLTPTLPIKPAIPPVPTGLPIILPVQPAPVEPITPSLLVKKLAIGLKIKPLGVVAAVAILLISGLAIYWLNYRQAVSEQKPATEEKVPVEVIKQPVPLLTVDLAVAVPLDQETKRINFDALEKVISDEPKIGGFKQIIFEQRDQKDILVGYLGVEELFKALDVRLFIDTSGQDSSAYTLFIYGQDSLSDNPFIAGIGRSRLGLIVKIKNISEAQGQLTKWEKDMVRDLYFFFLKAKPVVSGEIKFKDGNYRNIAIRYINLPDPSLSLDYALVGDKLVITTSQESIKAVIDGLLTQ